MNSQYTERGVTVFIVNLIFGACLAILGSELGGSAVVILSAIIAYCVWILLFSIFHAVNEMTKSNDKE